MRRFPAMLCAALALGAGSAPAAPGAAGQPAPLADHHQHLFSPAASAWLGASSAPHPITVDQLVADLDAAGIARAALLSSAYVYGDPARHVDDEYERVRAENDWAAAQAARYPERLVALCSFNPLKPYALLELARCATSPEFGRGIKLHFGNSDVQLDDPAHVFRLRQVFRAANARGMAVVVHLRASMARGRPYGAEQARVLLEQVLPYAQDVPVQVAHLAGTGPGYGDPQSHAAMAVLAEAAARRDPRMRQVWFDVASVAQPDMSPADARKLVRRLRQVGMERVLYGSDATVGNDLRTPALWAAFRRLPLTDAEAARVAGNLVPYLR
ncbi:amidohydrolase family protein [Massilia niastensis]|uniref:amidohydrolase family protein n=1 Tax=Massilia niastensis TaxID=544911 RepID=UPI0012EBBF09|nr:amidohydrolase family protein [Massilia niastensis]